MARTKQSARPSAARRAALGSSASEHRRVLKLAAKRAAEGASRARHASSCSDAIVAVAFAAEQAGRATAHTTALESQQRSGDRHMRDRAQERVADAKRAALKLCRPHGSLGGARRTALRCKYGRTRRGTCRRRPR